MSKEDADLPGPPQAVLPKTRQAANRSERGMHEARISTAVGAPTGAAVPVRLYQAAVLPLSGHRARKLPPRTPYERGMPCTQAPPNG